MARIVAIILQKGGTAKSVTTANLGMALAERGQRVLLIDLDPQASLTESLGVKPTDLHRSLHEVLIGEAALREVALPIGPLTLIPSVIDLASAELLMSAEVGRDQILTEALAPVLDQFDWILIDCPPSLSLLTLNALTAADEYLVPCETQFLALRGLDHLTKTIERIRRRTNPRLGLLGVLPTKYNPRTTLDNEVLAELRARYPGKVFEPIKFSVRFSESTVAGKALLEYDPKHPGAQSYRDLAEVVSRA
ncbi:MAG: ParA family protein [Oscillochloridaceae bacterium umkhey_bin13]